MTGLYLGIDGGGTACRARVADAAGRTLGEGLAGSANTRLGLDAAFAAIVAAAEAALDTAGLSRSCLGDLHAGLGLAGLALKSERAKVLDYPHPFATMRAESDAHAACLGAHAGGDGAILIVGTGSCGCALIDGEERTVGGWGFEMGDQGSGAWIGREAVRRALWAFEGMAPRTALGDAIMARFDHSPETVVLWGSAAKPRDFGALVPTVFAHAAKSDPLARAVVGEAAADVAAMIAKLSESGALGTALVGGVAAPITPYLDDATRSALVSPQGNALAGALRLAR